MARRTKKKHHAHRRRRVSGINKNSTLLMLAGAAGGYFLGQTLNDKLTDPVTGMLKSVDPKLLAAGEVLLGFLGPKALPAKLKTVGTIAGGFLIGAGAHEALKAFGVVSGLPLISGYKDLRAIAGIPTPGTQKNISSSLTSMQVISGVMDNNNCTY